MHRSLSHRVLALALSGACGLAHSAEPGPHNDMDGDGRSDVVWQNRDTGAVVYWHSADAATFTTVRVPTPAGFDLRRTSIALTYSDVWTPRNVLLAKNSSSGADFQLYYLGPAYHAYAMWAGSFDSVAVGAGDFNGDGSADLLYRHQSDGQNFMISGVAWADWAEYYPLTTVSNLAWKVAGIGDFDGDGRSDIFWRNASTGQNTVWRSGSAATPIATTVVPNLAWKVAAVGDFNGDGRDDLFWRNASTGANVIWDSGRAATTRAATAVTNLAWSVTATGDYDGDGRTDLFWRNGSTGANAIWKSANAATPQAVRAVSSQAWRTVK